MNFDQFVELLDLLRSCSRSLERLAIAAESSVALDPMTAIAQILMDDSVEPADEVLLDETKVSTQDFVRLIQR